MNTFWHNFFSNPWISSGLLHIVPAFILTDLMLLVIGLECSDKHSKWRKKYNNAFKQYKFAAHHHNKREAQQAYQQYLALKKKKPSIMSSRGWIRFWLTAFGAIFLLILGAISDHYHY